MKVTLDTNVLIAAFISRGVCHDLFEHLVRHHTVVSSEFIMREFRRILIDKIGVPKSKVSAAEGLIREGAVFVPDAELETNLSRDHDDDWILSVAESSESECIVTGDDDLLSLEEFRGIQIIRPSEFWEFEAKGFGEG